MTKKMKVNEKCTKCGHSFKLDIDTESITIHACDACGKQSLYDYRGFNEKLLIGEFESAMLDLHDIILNKPLKSIEINWIYPPAETTSILDEPNPKPVIKAEFYSQIPIDKKE